jgi:ABC-type Fe3+/spermidine/putrescine transport system ATPase subunit
MIELKNINHYYGDKQVLNNFSTIFEKGKLTCLLGSSGSGKTTILRLIAGLEIPESGEISINKTIVTRNKKIIVTPDKRELGFIFQDLALWPHMTVFDNIAFGLKERKQKNIKHIVTDILSFFGLSGYQDKYPHQLSGGQKQLIAIARSLVLNPSILLMDEPLANLDVNLKLKIINHIKKIKENFNLTIVYVTHDISEADSLSDIIVKL